MRGMGGHSGLAGGDNKVGKNRTVEYAQWAYTGGDNVRRKQEES